MNMARTALGLIFLALAASPSAADEALAAPVAQCIKDNASKVELAIADLNQAVDFLITDICAEPVAAQQALEAKAAGERQSARWQKMCEETQAEAKKNPSASENDKGYGDLCSSTKIAFLTEPTDLEGSYTLYAGVASRTPAAAALASRLLLDLRLSHVKRQP